MCLFTNARTVAIVFARSAGSEAMYCAGVLTFAAGFINSSFSATKCITERLKTSQRQGNAAKDVASAQKGGWATRFCGERQKIGKGVRPAQANKVSSIVGQGLIREYSPRKTTFQVAPLSLDFSQVCWTSFGFNRITFTRFTTGSALGPRLVPSNSAVPSVILPEVKT